MSEPYYVFDMVLRHDWGDKYYLLTKDNKLFHTIFAATDTDAMEQAEIFMSCWASVRIEWEKKEE